MTIKFFRFLVPALLMLVVPQGVLWAKSNLAADFYAGQGKKEYKAKQYDNAIVEFRKALLADPDHEESLMYLRILGFGGSADRSNIREQDQLPRAQYAQVGPLAPPAALPATTALPSTLPPPVLSAVDPLGEIQSQIEQEEAQAIRDLRQEAYRKQLEYLKTIKNEDGKPLIDPGVRGLTEEGLVVSPSTPTSLGGSTASPHAVDIEKFVADFLGEDPALDQETVPSSSTDEDIRPRDEFSVKEQALREKIAEETEQKILKVHKKYAAQPIGPDTKTVFRDIDGDGVPEAISLKENAVIEKIEVRAEKELASGLKKIRKEKAAEERAELKREKKKTALAKSEPDNVLERTDLKAGQIVAGGRASGDTAATRVQQDRVKPPSPAEPSAGISSVGDEDVKKILSEMRAEMIAQEKDLELKYAKKKAIRLAEAEQKAAAKPQEPKAQMDISEDLAQLGSPAEKTFAPAPAVPEGARAVQAENVVLKKKLAQIVEMSQKDQDVIKGLEREVQLQDEKMAVLEVDLKQTQRNLDTKVEMLQEKEDKLQELSERIVAIESEVNSKQFDFKDKQIEYEKKIQAIQEEMGNFKAERSNSEEQLREQLKILKEALAKKIAELNAAQEKLIFTENKLRATEDKYVLTIKQFNDLQGTLTELESRLATLSVPEVPAVDEEPLVEIDPKNLPAPRSQNEVVYQRWIIRQESIIARLKEKLLWARDQMEFLGRYDIKLNDQKMAALKEQLAAVKRQLGSVQSVRTEEDFALLEARLKDSQERLNMVEGILREKDDQVKELEKQLNEVLSSF